MKHKKSGNFSFNDWVYSLAVTVRLASWLLAGFVSVVVTLSLTYCVWIMFTYCDEFFPLEPMLGCCGCRKHGGLLCRNVELSKVLSFKLAVGQKIAFHALSTAENSAILIFTLPIHSASFLSPILFIQRILCVSNCDFDCYLWSDNLLFTLT